MTAPLRWPLYALLGLLVACAIAFLATRVVSEKIGISSEPVSAGEALAPKGTGGARAPATVPTTPAPGVRTEPSDDSTGGGAAPSAGGGESESAGDD